MAEYQPTRVVPKICQRSLTGVDTGGWIAVGDFLLFCIDDLDD